MPQSDALALREDPLRQYSAPFEFLSVERHGRCCPPPQLLPLLPQGLFRRLRPAPARRAGVHGLATREQADAAIRIMRETGAPDALFLMPICASPRRDAVLVCRERSIVRGDRGRVVMVQPPS